MSVHPLHFELSHLAGDIKRWSISHWLGSWLGSDL